MASVAHLHTDSDELLNDIEQRLLVYESNVVVYFVSARYIQKIFRGYITRKHMALIHESATCIQKNWRAYVGRVIYRGKLKEKFDEMCWTYYCNMATRIQKFWRGYWIRSKIFSYYRLKSWLAFVTQQNKIFKCSVELCQNKKNITELKQREDEAKEWIIYILFKLHHMLRTHQSSGIYSLPNTTKLSEIEKMLKCLKYKDFMVFYNEYMKVLREDIANKKPPYKLQNCKYPARYEREYYEHKKPKKDYLCRGSYHDPQWVKNLGLKERVQPEQYLCNEELQFQPCTCQKLTPTPDICHQEPISNEVECEKPDIFNMCLNKCILCGCEINNEC